MLPGLKHSASCTVIWGESKLVTGSMQTTKVPACPMSRACVYIIMLSCAFESMLTRDSRVLLKHSMIQTHTFDSLPSWSGSKSNQANLKPRSFSSCVSPMCCAKSAEHVTNSPTPISASFGPVEGPVSSANTQRDVLM